jgi:uncharacterized protein with NRDE domain
MCLILLSFRVHHQYPLLLAANRDEFYERPSAPVSFWNDAPEVLAGRDLKDGGTWLGMTRKGRIAAVTNYRDPASFKDNAPSRGWLVRDYLDGSEEPAVYLKNVAARADQYNAFSLILGDTSHLYYFSNRGYRVKLSPGLYGLSNHLLDTPWSKVERGKAALASLLARRNPPGLEEIFSVLSDQTRPEDDRLPNTGVGLEWERILSAIFIKSPVYGTRSSTVVMIDRKHHVVLAERVFNDHPDPWMTAEFKFRIQMDSHKERFERKCR